MEDRDRSLKQRIKELYAARDEARKKLTAFEKGLADAQQRDRLFGSRGSLLFGLISARDAFNLPGFDFAAPKGTPGREEIKQVVLPSVRTELNFAQSYATDRCTTCHIEIDNPEMTRDNFAATLERALANINEQRRSAGTAPMASPASFGATTQPAGGRPRFSEMNTAQKQAHIEALLQAVNAYLREQGRAEVHMDRAMWAHPDLDLYVSADSPHAMSRMGCTVCHEGNGQETDFILASHTPESRRQAHEWEKTHYVRRMGLPETTLHTAHEFWERPMLLPKFTSASCAKCHTKVSDVELREGESLASARPITQGRDLFVGLGCINCHAVEGLTDSRQVGPDLSHVALKLSKGFMHRWIEYPKHFRPSTRMPHYFHQENNLPSSRSEDDPQPLLRTETEIQAITHYLLTFSKPYEAFEPPEGVAGDAKRGEALFTSIGCLACHADIAAKDPNDEQGRTLAERWIVPDLIHAGESPERAAERFKSMSANERLDYAWRNFTPERRMACQSTADAERRAAEREGRDPDAKRLYVPPIYTRFAPDLSGMGTKLLPDPQDARQRESARKWLYDWLHEPRHYSSYTKMPRLFRDDYYWKLPDRHERRRQNDQDILDISEYLLSLRHDGFKSEAIPADTAHANEARRLIRLLLEGQNTESVATAILNDARVHPKDECGPLTDRIVRGVAKSFGEGEAGIRAAAERVSKQDLAGRQMLFLGSKMITHYGCYACHSIPGFESASRPGTELTTWARKLLSQIDFAFFADGFEEDRKAQPALFGKLFPDSAEYEQLVRDCGGNIDIEVEHTHASFAYHKLRNPRIWDRGKLKRPYEKLKMPNFFLTEDEATSLATFLLSRQAPLVASELDVSYVDTPAGRIAMGRQAVTELNCVGCHSIEDNFATVHQYYIKPDPASGELTFDVMNAPPNLHGEGAKIQYPWLFGFLNQVEMLRPWLQIRMPSFHLDTTRTTHLVEYFAGQSEEESQSLNRRLTAIHNYRASTAKPGTAGTESAAGAADWFKQPSLSSAALWLGRYALRNKLITPYDLDTGSASSAEDAEATLRTGYQKVLETTDFLARLYQVTYPFASNPRPLAEAKRYDDGRRLLWELKCLACHVAGEPSAPGTTTDIKAPNLALAHRRLRYDWVQQWLISPQWIQPGTNMPQLFGGSQSAFKDFPEDKRKPLEALFGSSGERQIPLLVDFLFDLGIRNQTVVQPAAPAGGPASAPPAGAAPVSTPKAAATKPAVPGKSEPEKKKTTDEFEP